MQQGVAGRTDEEVGDGEQRLGGAMQPVHVGQRRPHLSLGCGTGATFQSAPTPVPWLRLEDAAGNKFQSALKMRPEACEPRHTR